MPDRRDLCRLAGYSVWWVTAERDRLKPVVVAGLVCLALNNRS